MAAALVSHTFAISPMPKPHINLPPKTLEIPRSCSVKLESLKDVCKQGKLAAAAELFSSLFVDRNRIPAGFCLDEAYAVMTELCATVRALSPAQQIHAHMVTSGVVSDSVFLNTKLVMMYGKCGAVEDAGKVFDKMPHRTTFTWNCMIGAWISGGDYLKALRLYRDMRVCGVSLDAYTFPCVLKGCGATGDLRTGVEIHGLAIKHGCLSIGFVVNALVSMYSKCGDLCGARRLFDTVTERDDVVLWNSMIMAYSGCGYATEALSAYRDMQSEGVAGNTYTFVAALQACEEESFRSLGQQIHASVLRSGCHLDVYVANALLAFYARIGDMTHAANIFQNMDQRDHVSWNTMLTGLAQNGFYTDVLSLFKDALEARLRPDQVSVLSIAMAAGRLGNLLIGKEVHAYAVKHGLDRDLQVGNTLLDMYSKCSSVVHMNRVFDRMDIKDLVSRTTVIAGHAQNNGCVKALELFREAQTGADEIDPLMLGIILLACRGLKSNSHVKQVHAYIIRRGISDLMLQNNLVDVYGECGLVPYAAGVFELMEAKDVVTWTSLITCYTNNGLAKEALELFNQMKHSGLDPDFVVLVSLLSAVTSFSSLKKGKEIHGFLVRKGIEIDGSMLNSLVDMYANCGSLDSSCKLFNRFRNSDDLTLWTSMINAYGIHGHGAAAIDLFERMEKANLFPDHVTFLALLQACSHSGLIDEGKKYFEAMESKYALEPWPEHYVCLVDLLGRANHLGEAFRYVQTMRTEPGAEVWCALLSACRIHSNEELGDRAAEELLKLNPANPGNYVLVSNVYASNRRWKEVDRVRMRMKENELRKNPGCSWMEAGNKIHAFTARDQSHPQSDEIYQKLTEITEKLGHEGGYIAQTSSVLHDVAQEDKASLLYAHSERLAIAYGLITTSDGLPIRVTKNLRVCGDCHRFCELVSKLYERELIIRDAKRFHHFRHGSCSCGNFW